MKDIRASGAPFPAIHYWMPDRTGDAQEDYRIGQEHFYEAVRASVRQGVGMFLPHVVMAMYGSLGPMEHGFLDALLKAAQVGTPAPQLTDEEMAGSGDTLEQERAHEREMADAIACRKWAPDMMRVNLFALLAGVDGEHIGAAITMIARTAINGTRN
ncbi:hypothetical protein [Bradyrhizobium sp. 195]|uniref:hypothetical protein n=1 Tax=Bradyrhizobium sp. 195 TaxID=2782662 RepID=UPI0020017C46|nr:hypothetical protein [Bradyrhizobium sp. 195]UPK28394.1 hypothetical protein IVB26_08245 [Bradyrhizobium sp. 195]